MNILADVKVHVYYHFHSLGVYNSNRESLGEKIAE